MRLRFQGCSVWGLGFRVERQGFRARGSLDLYSTRPHFGIPIVSVAELSSLAFQGMSVLKVCDIKSNTFRLKAQIRKTPKL